jgi:hypothetical protein
MLLDTSMSTINRRRIETPYATDDDIISFGRYAGLNLEKVPAAYWRQLLKFRWFAEQHPTLHAYARRRCPNSRAVSVHDHPYD